MGLVPFGHPGLLPFLRIQARCPVGCCAEFQRGSQECALGPGGSRLQHPPDGPSSGPCGQASPGLAGDVCLRGRAPDDGPFRQFPVRQAGGDIFRRVGRCCRQGSRLGREQRFPGLMGQAVFGRMALEWSNGNWGRIELGVRALVGLGVTRDGVAVGIQVVRVGCGPAVLQEEPVGLVPAVEVATAERGRGLHRARRTGGAGVLWGCFRG